MLDYFGRRKPRRVLVPVEAWYNATGDIDCCIAYYQPKGAVSYAASLVNLANPGTYDAAGGIDPAWTPARGWIFSTALGTYLDTGVVPERDYSCVVKFANVVTGNDGSLYGSYDAGDVSDTDCWEDEERDAWVWFYGDGSVTMTPLVKAGVTGMAASTPYLNGEPGAAVTTGVLNWSAVPPSLYVGAVNDAVEGPSWSITADIHAFAVYGCTLTDTQMRAVCSALMQL